MVLMRLLDVFLLPKTVARDEDIGGIQLSDSLYQNVFIFKYLGYWPPRKGTRWFFPYAVYSAWMTFWIVYMWNITQFVNLYFIADDLEQVAASLYITTCTGVEIIKAYYFLKLRYVTGAVVKSLDREIFKPKNVAEYEVVAEILRFSQITYVVFKSCAVIMVFFWGTYPIFDTNVQRRLPFLAWFPWDYWKTPYYELCYAYQVFGAFYMAFLNITIDTTASGLMSNIFAQYDLLSHKLAHMYENTEIRLKEKGRKDITPEIVYENMYDTLEHCVQHHKNILELAASVGGVFNVSVFYQFFISAAILCMTTFQLTLVRPFSLECFSLIFYQICILLEVAMYCWFGNEVILRSENVVKAAFSAQWMDCSPKFKKNLLFFMTRCSRPMRMYAGGFFTLSVETFTLILRSSLSYFAVLRQVHSE